MTNKLPSAKDWRNRDLSDWNTTTFTEYMRDKHRELFGCEYAPMRGWQAEMGMIGRLIGTRAKKGTHSKAMIKRFIDEAFETYKPTPQYPGTNFGFIYSYRRQILQRLEAEESEAVAKEMRKEQTRKNVEKQAKEIDDIMDWL